MSSSSRRLPFALALVAAVPLVLAACAPTSLPLGDDDDAPATPGASSEPSATPDAGSFDLPDDLTFAAGADLDAGTSGQWGDAMMADEDFAVETGDDGNGSWSYTHLATQCVVGFWQGDVTSLGPSADDSELSDKVLGWHFQASADEVAAYASDEELPLNVGGTGSFAVRSIVGESPETGGEYLVSARGFDAFSGGYIVSVTCPEGQSPIELRDQLRGSHLTLILGPGGGQ